MSDQTTPDESGPEATEPTMDVQADDGARTADKAPATASETAAVDEAPGSAEAPADDVRAGEREAVPFWRKVPLWLWIVLAVLLLGGGAVGIIASSGAFDPEPLPTPPAETITAAPPTPTATPIERTVEATEFSAALPDTVLDLALAEMIAGGTWTDREPAPLEAYVLTYSDGGAKSVTLDVAQYQDAESATSALPETVDGEAETGEVIAGGVPVGEYWILVAGEGNTTIMWRNSTALFVLRGDEALVRDVYRAFPL